MKRFLTAILCFGLSASATAADDHTVITSDMLSASAGRPSVISSVEPDAAPAGARTTRLRDIAYGLISLCDGHTGIAPSFPGAPGYEHLAFTTDAALQALAFHACGYDSQCRKILDFIAQRILIAEDEFDKHADTNGVWGLLKRHPLPSVTAPGITLINTIDVTDDSRSGKGRAEFYVEPETPGFLTCVFLQVDRKTYHDAAAALGGALLALQSHVGAVGGGDRSPETVNTSAQITALSAFEMLYTATGDDRWRQAADKAFRYLSFALMEQDTGTVYHGSTAGIADPLFSSATYIRLLLSPAADRLPATVIKKVTDTLIERSLAYVNVTLPDGTSPTLMLIDSHDPSAQAIEKTRNGYHPGGSPALTAAFVTALQKSAARLHLEGNHTAARNFKGLAAKVSDQLINAFYFSRRLGGSTSFRFSAQNIVPAPGCRATPTFTTTDAGSTAANAWTLLMSKGVNPLIPDDPFHTVLMSIPEPEALTLHALHRYTESPADRPSHEAAVPMDPEALNARMWESLAAAEAARAAGDHQTARIHYQQARTWAARTVSDRSWYALALRDNLRKRSELGGIVSYPRGTTWPHNEHPLHTAILRYPLLNEIATALWGLAVCSYELGEYATAGQWIRRIIEDVPLHQIPSVKTDPATGEVLIDGYWNALVAWEQNPDRNLRDTKMQSIYGDVLKEMNITTAVPREVGLQEDSTH